MLPFVLPLTRYATTPQDKGKVLLSHIHVVGFIYFSLPLRLATTDGGSGWPRTFLALCDFLLGLVGLDYMSLGVGSCAMGGFSHWSSVFFSCTIPFQAAGAVYAFYSIGALRRWVRQWNGGYFLTLPATRSPSCAATRWRRMRARVVYEPATLIEIKDCQLRVRCGRGLLLIAYMTLPVAIGRLVIATRCTRIDGGNYIQSSPGHSCGGPGSGLALALFAFYTFTILGLFLWLLAHERRGALHVSRCLHSAHSL